MKSSLRANLFTAVLFLPVSFVYAVGFCWCYQPNDIAFGGITGVAQIIQVFVPAAPVGTVTILLNIPLFLLCWFLLGGGTLLCGCDLLARLLFAPYELPVGIVLSLLGGPFFLWLLLGRRGGVRHG